MGVGAFLQRPVANKLQEWGREKQSCFFSFRGVLKPKAYPSHLLTQGLNGPECGISTCFFFLLDRKQKVQEITVLRVEVDMLLDEEEVMHYSDSGA